MDPKDLVLDANEFYSRQILMKELGAKGQQKLSESKVAIVGLGGLGAVSSLYLSLSGVGFLRLIDQDTVELHNLHRQILYHPEDLNYPKAEVAAKKLQMFNPLIKTEGIAENLHPGNVERLLSGVDLVLDGLDNMSTRYVINRACVKLGIPYVFGAAIGLEGNLSVFHTPETPCLECVMPNLLDTHLQPCESRGVLSPTPGIIGTMQANEALKVLTGIGKPLKGKLMVCDFADMSFYTLDISKRVNCSICAKDLPETHLEKNAWMCATNTAYITCDVSQMPEMNQISEKIKELGLNLRAKTNLSVVFDYKDYQISVFKGGNVIIKNVTDENTALKICNEL
ncbi:MAG: HesA/MoeB/ThiF family protein, partial [Crenarchaeota archaeon]|nr:HesA/MoeB/ThiF family protein [Thermoproteota archaeon]